MTSVENLEEMPTYLLEEIKEDFDEFELGDTGIRIKMREHTGVGRYVNFSKRCRVLANSEGAKYPVGTDVWLPHIVANNTINGEAIDSSLKGKNTLYCGEYNILFAGEVLTEIESDEWVVFQTKKGGIEEGEIVLVEQGNDEEGVVVCGALPKGSEITWVTHKRQEVYQKEVQYWVSHIDEITTINGEVNTKCEYYKIDTFDDYETTINGLLYLGQAAKLKEHKLGKLPVKHFIARLENHGLPYNEKLAIVRKARKGQFVHRDEVLLIVENADLGIEGYKPV